MGHYPVLHVYKWWTWTSSHPPKSYICPTFCQVPAADGQWAHREAVKRVGGRSHDTVQHAAWGFRFSLFFCCSVLQMCSPLAPSAFDQPLNRESSCPTQNGCLHRKFTMCLCMHCIQSICLHQTFVNFTFLWFCANFCTSGWNLGCTCKYSECFAFRWAALKQGCSKISFYDIKWDQITFDQNNYMKIR